MIGEILSFRITDFSVCHPGPVLGCSVGHLFRCRKAVALSPLEAGACPRTGPFWIRTVPGSAAKRGLATVGTRNGWEMRRRALPSERRPAMFWFIVAFLAVSVVLMLAGQTLGVFNYELAARMGLQGKPEEMTEFGVLVTLREV